MKTTIGVQQMRDTASEMVRRAEAGEVIIITRHRTPVAQLGPIEITVKGEDRPEPKMEAS